MIQIELEIDNEVVISEFVNPSELKIKIKMLSHIGQSSRRPYAVFYHKASKLGLGNPIISDELKAKCIQMYETEDKTLAQMQSELQISVRSIKRILQAV